MDNFDRMSNRLKAQSAKYIEWTIQNVVIYRDRIVPAVCATLVGGTVIYFWSKKRRNKKEKKTPGNGKQSDVSLLQISMLPPEARKLLWKKLPYADLLQLRLVCEMLKEDVDTLIGLKMDISSYHEEEYIFSQHVALQTCLITDLTTEIDSNFFADPYLLEKLALREKTSISLSNVIKILSPCINLQQLKLRFLHSSDISAISEIVLSVLQNMTLLTHLRLFKVASSPSHDKILPAIPTHLLQLYRFPQNLRNVELEIPDVSEDQIPSWIAFLETQNKIQRLTVNFGPISWKHLENTIKNNKNLEEVGLLNIRNYIVQRGIDEVKPFDWAMFQNCSKLVGLEINCSRTSGPQGDELLQTMNFSALPCLEMVEFFVSRVIMSPADVTRVYQEMPHLKTGSLDHIGNEGTQTANELSWRFYQEQLTVRQDWYARERIWDGVLLFAMMISSISIYFFSNRLKNGESVEVDEDKIIKMVPLRRK